MIYLKKEKRLRLLQRYWSNELRTVNNIQINTPVAEERSCGIANVGVKGIAPAKLAKVLLDEFNVWTVAIDYENVKGCRITPNIYNSLEELDQFVIAMKTIAKRV